MALIIQAILVLAASSAATPNIDNVSEQIAAVKRAAPAALERHKTPGAAVAIVAEGRVAWSGGFGVAERGGSELVTADTAFPAASVTKPVTAWAILKLVAAGVIDRDAPIETYVTRWRLPPSDHGTSGVTARSILAHAAGLSFGGDPGVSPNGPVPSLEEAADGVGQEGGPLTIAYPPGAAYRYSSKGYILLELAVEEATGESFAAYTTREILAPLGMERSSFDPSDLPARARGHDWYGRVLPDFALATKAQGGLWTTAGDMARFLAAAMPGPAGESPGRGVIPVSYVEETFTPFPFSEDTAEVGLGYNLDRNGDLLVVRKSGDRRGYKAIVFSVPQRGAGLVILANSDRAAAGVFADIACPWSATVSGHPLRAICGQLYMIRNIHFAGAAVLAAVSVAIAISMFRALRRGDRSMVWPPSRRRVAGICLFAAFLLLWWGFWYSDIPLRLLGYPQTFYTVRFDPWPTAFIWVSCALSLLFAALALRLLAPKITNLSSSAR